MKPTIFSGVQPSGIPTIGNYVGAMRNFVQLQEDYDAIYCIVNQHAITVYQDPQKLHQMTRQIAALYLSLGVDPQKATVFVQSDVPAHTKAAWYVICHTGVGELERMTQYKDKSAKQETVGAGLLCYPPLMVADIILYDAAYVPVGEDQKQHLELTRNFVDRFNGRYSQAQPLLVKPEPIIPSAGGRIMSLQDPSSKMSKSDTNTKAYISLLDDPKTITKKIKSAVTDSIGLVNYDRIHQPAISNLLDIFAAFSNQSVDELVNIYHDSGYGKFKNDLADVLIAFLEPMQARYQKLVDSDELTQILKNGALVANDKANQTLAKMEKAMGISY